MSVKFLTVFNEKLAIAHPEHAGKWREKLFTLPQAKTKPPIVRTLQIYWQFARAYRRAITIALIGLPVVILVQSGLLPLTYSKVIDQLNQTGGHIPHLETWIALFVGLHLVVFTGQRVNARFWSKLEHTTIKDMEQHIFGSLLAQSNQFHTGMHAGGLVAQAKRFTGGFSSLMNASYYNLYALLVRIMVAFSFMLFIAPLMAFILLLWTVIYAGSILWLTKRKMFASEAAAQADSTMTSHLADTIGNASAVKTFGSEDAEGAVYAGLSHDKYARRRLDWRLSELILAWQGVLMIVLETVVLSLSVQLVQDGTFTIGTLALIQFFLAPILVSLWQIAIVFRQVETGLSDAAEMTETLGLEPAIKDQMAPPEARIEKGEIDFQDVTFSYGTAEHRLLSDFNLHIKPGETVGLVGPSGSGKTSLTKLLLRFMDIESGAIKIDGQNIAMLRQADLRRRIAFVSQEPQLFHRTIKENIRYANPDASDEEIVAAARQARAHDFIKKLPGRYETMVGERGAKLSGGERQRIAIARAMLKDAPIVVLDEATSALDSESEKLIQAAFETLMQGRTAIVIAHRLCTVQKMDRIVVLKDGEVIEEGPHDALLQQKGLYAQLWRHQSGS